MRREAPTALAGLALLGGLVCGAASADEASKTITITAEEFAFRPDAVEVEKGTGVRILFRNEGALTHSMEIEKLGARTPTIQKGETRTLRFRPEETGTYRFRCTVPGHEQAGMTGTLRVVGGQGS